MKYLTEEETKKANENIEREKEKYRREQERNKKIKTVLCAIFYPPLAIAFKAFAVVSKLIGCIAAIGIPYGVYCAYKTVVQLRDNVQLQEIKQVKFVLLFIALPFAAFAVHAAADKLHDYFYIHA